MSWLLQWEEELRKLDELLVLLAQAPPSPEPEIAQETYKAPVVAYWGQGPLSANWT